MGRYLLRRAFFALVLVVCTSCGALLLTRLAPGDVTTELGPFARASEVAAVRERYGLDRRPLAQLGDWVSRAIRFDFGDSFIYNAPVAPLVARAALNTFALASIALAVSTVAGLGLGVITGTRRGLLPGVVRAVSILALSMPPLLTSLLLVFAAARTGWLPAGGMSSIGASEMTWPAWLADLAAHLPLPVIALALPTAATFERLQSQSLRETMREPFVAAAAAKGLSPRDVVWRHAWRVSLRPICGVYGIAIGALLSGSFIVEFITTWPGLGRMMFEALRARDIYLVAGCATAGSVFLAAGTLAGDLLLAVADPRVGKGWDRR
jgi:peptide/nickel transport system permease protein